MHCIIFLAVFLLSTSHARGARTKSHQRRGEATKKYTVSKSSQAFAAFLTVHPGVAFEPSLSGQHRGLPEILRRTSRCLLPVMPTLRHPACVHAGLINDEKAFESEPIFAEQPPQLAASCITPRRNAASNWFYNLKTLPNSVILQRIKSPLLVNFIVTFLACFWHAKIGPLPRLVELPHKLLGSALGLLLVFRTNKAYDRVWEACKQWGIVVNECRALAALACTFMNPQQARPILSLVDAFPVVMRNYLLRDHDTRSLKNVLVKEEIEALSAAENQPQYVLSRLRHLSQASAELGVMEKEREMLLKCATVLGECISTCEHIYDTPIPLAYSRHILRFLMLYVLSLPFALVHALGWETLIVTTMLSWALFGILEIGNLIEEPFLPGTHPPLLPMFEVCDTIHEDVRAIAEFPQFAKNHSVPTIDVNPAGPNLDMVSI